MKLWIVDDSGSYETCMALVRAETFEAAKKLLTSTRYGYHAVFASLEAIDREISTEGEPGIVWIYERSWDPCSD